MAELDSWVTRLARLNTAAIEARARRRGSTTAEDEVLGALERFGPTLSPTALRRLVLQSPGGLTKTLRRLEGADLVTRSADPDDGRGLLVQLTAAGRGAAAQVLADRDAHYEGAFHTLDADDRDTLRDLVREVLDNLEQATGATPTNTDERRPRES